MQPPAGHEIVDGVFHAKDCLAVLFDPSFPDRFVHMLLASTLTVAFFIIGLASWQILRAVAGRSAPRVLRAGLTLAAVTIPIQMVVSDFHGLNTLEHQPQKIAALEAVWNTERGAPLLLFAIPDETARTNHFEIAIPRLGSLILTHDIDGEIKGLNDFRDRHPPVLPLSFAFRLMVGMGVDAARELDRLVAVPPLRLNADRLPRPLLRVFAAMTFIGWVATVAGWYVTEIGRQPYIVYGLIRTSEVASNVPAPLIATTLALYVTLYLALIVAYVAVLKYMAEKPEDVLDQEARDRAATPPGAITPPLATR